MAKFLIADDHPLFREALQGALANHYSDLQLREAEDLDSTLVALQEDDDLDLLLLDLHMPGSGDLYGLIRIREDYPLVPIAIISGTEEPAVVAKCIGFGALGFIPKSLPSLEIAAAIDVILQGDTWVPAEVRGRLAELTNEEQELAKKVADLTPQQYRVLLLLHEGLLNKQIAYQLNITEATVKAHITAIFKKLGVYSRTQAVLLVERLQLEPNKND
ncbi:two component transcriptional regulator, LuxR family [Pseudidiomarina indica]|uniref:Two component transcriptional regulator, LuxR family n=1 Tax=Pseudidiomarina indica TaxID=1159017 RepID=A0A1G6BHP1_9GAMM|nr:response regulator transcription factor [Pseudidiomarina indica]SDB20145.1 two component transcriptional regulator, LuxR family [Pseudidiomarina indica]